MANIKKTILWILILTILLVPTINAETIIGNKVYINDTNAYLSVEPHTITQGWQYAYPTLISKAFSGNINIVFGYNSNTIRPTEFEYLKKQNYTNINGTEINNDTWININVPQSNNIAWNYQGMTNWRYITGMNINANQLYETRIKMNVAEGDEGKYWFCVYPTSYGTNIQNANSNGHLYCLDPWYNISGSIVFNETNLTTGIVAYFTFDEPTGNLTDSVTGISNMTSYGFKSNNTNCKIGNCRWNSTFEGTSYIQMRTNDLMPKGANNRTFNIWVNDLSTSLPASEYLCFLSYGYYGALHQFFQYNHVFNNAKMGFTGYGSSDINTAFITRQTGWRMITIVVNASGNATTHTFYVNGTLNSTSTSTVAIDTGTTDLLRLGLPVTGHTPGGQSCEAMDVMYDEFGIWNRSLNTTEIQLLYAIQKDGAISGQYPFNVSAPAGEASITVTINTPTDNEIKRTYEEFTHTYTINSSSLTKNITCNETYNGTTSQTFQRTNTLPNISVTYNRTINDTTNREVTRTMQIYCYNEEATANALRTYIFDDIAPRLIIYPNSTFTINTTSDWISINRTFEDFTDVSTTYIQLEDKYNYTNTSTTNTSTDNRNLNITLYGIGNWVITGYAIDEAGNRMNYTTNFTILPDSNYFTFNFLNYLGTSLITGVDIFDNFSTTHLYSNPYQKDINTYLNKTAIIREIKINATDTSYQHMNGVYYYNITRHNLTYNVTATPAKIYLNFTQLGSAKMTSGYIADQTPKRLDFINTSIIAVQQEIADGPVSIQFGANGSGNYTQYYEYINDGTEVVSEDIEILVNPTSSINVKVLDSGRVPIENAKIRMYIMYNSTGTWLTGDLIGQRLTLTDGTTYFNTDPSNVVYIRAYADGYETKDIIYQPSAVVSYPASSPYEIILPFSQTSINDTYVNMVDGTTPQENWTTNTGLYIATGMTTAEITTDYRISNGLPIISLTSTCTRLDECAFTVRRGTDCPMTGNCTIYFYKDNELIQEITIRPTITTYTEILDIKDKVDEIAITEETRSKLLPLFVIALLIITLILQKLFTIKNDGEMPFFFGTIIISMIEPLFLAITVILGIAMVMRWLNRILYD